ncbi:MAG: host-nuclease inhibitor Gam family protein [Terriglobia bacterium]
MKTLPRPSGFSQEFSLPRPDAQTGVGLHGHPGRRPPVGASGPPRRIQTWAEADNALAELGKLQREQARLSARRAKALAGIEQRAARLQARAQGLAAALEKFSRQQAVNSTGPNSEPTTTLTASRRSRRLVFGRVGFRRVHRLAVRDAERAVRALRRNGLSRFLRLEPELNREALHRCLLEARTNSHGSATPQKLARAGIRLTTRDTWFYELHRQAIERWG